MVFSKNFLEGMIGSLQLCLEVEDKHFIEAYEKFYAESIGNPSGFVLWKRDNFSLKASEPRYSSEFNIGVDLPLYFTKEGNVKNIVVLGEDPLRPEKSKRELEIIISTPFALQCFQPKLPSHKLIFWIVKELLSKGYNVYVTDVFKAWIKAGSSKVDLFKDEIFLSNSMRCLQSELELLATLNGETAVEIITLGTKANRALTKMKKGGDSKNVIHKNWNHPAAWFRHKQQYYQDRFQEME